MRRQNGAAIVRQLEASGIPRERWPVEANAPPVLYPFWTTMAMSAFYDLSTERDCSWSLGPIPWTAIHTWGSARGLRGDMLRVFEFVIRQMDAAYMPIEAERLRIEAEQASKNRVAR